MQPLNSPLVIGSRYQIVEDEKVLMEIYFPTHKVGLNVFGEIFKSENSRYNNATSFVIRGQNWDLGRPLPNTEIKISKIIPDILLSIANGKKRTPEDQATINDVMEKCFPENVRPSEQDRFERLAKSPYSQQRNELIQVAADKFWVEQSKLKNSSTC